MNGLALDCLIGMLSEGWGGGKRVPAADYVNRCGLDRFPINLNSQARPLRRLDVSVSLGTDDILHPILVRFVRYRLLIITGISFLTLRQLRLYTRLPPVEPSGHGFSPGGSQRLPATLFRVPKTHRLGFQNQLFQTPLHSCGISESFP